MKRTQFNKFKNKLTKLLTEFSDFYKEHGIVKEKQTWKIDECNSLTWEGDYYVCFVDGDELYDLNNLSFNMTLFLQQYLEYLICETSDYEENISIPISKRHKESKKKFKNYEKRINRVLNNPSVEYDYRCDYDYDHILDDLYDNVPIETIIEKILTDLESIVEDEIKISFDNKTWEDCDETEIEGILESNGITDGDLFYIKTNGKVKQHIAKVQTIEERHFSYS